MNNCLFNTIKYFFYFFFFFVFMQSVASSSTTQLDYSFEAESGGISENGKYYWMVSDNDLELFRLPIGNRVGSWSFIDHNGEPVCFIFYFI